MLIKNIIEFRKGDNVKSAEGTKQQSDGFQPIGKCIK